MSNSHPDDQFELPVQYKGNEVMLPGRLVRWGYSYRLLITVEGQDLIFEPDEERNFRVIQEHSSGATVPVDLVRAIIEALDKHLR